jgi:hypothetical protein
MSDVESPFASVPVELAREATTAPGADGSDRPRRSRRGGRRRGRAKRGDNANATSNAPAAKTDATRERKAKKRADPAHALGESLQAAVLRHTTAAVLGRGRGYARGGRVSELRVTAGRVRARVLGSGDERYHVELQSPQQPPPPVVHKIRWSCNCPYAAEHRRGTCKHVAATALVAAERIAGSDSLRRRWLGEPASNAPEADPEEFDALAERLLEAFTASPVDVDAVIARAVGIAPAPFDLVERAR